MGIVEGRVKCICCKEEIKIKIKIKSIDNILVDLEREFKNNDWTIVNVEDDEIVNIICNECIDFVMNQEAIEC